MKIYIDEELPKSCASCQFLVHCDQCEGSENYCPFVGSVGYDISDNLIDGTPVTPATHRHRHCPVVARPHGEWKLRSPYEAWFEEYKCSNCNAYGWFNWHFCPNCGSDNRKAGEKG